MLTLGRTTRYSLGIGSLIFMFGFGQFTTKAFADDAGTYTLSTSDFFVPKGYDDNDNIQVVLDGWMDSSCDKMQTPKVEAHPEQGTFYVEVKAQRSAEECMPVLTRFTAVADLGVVPAGVYYVVTNNGWLVHQLIVNEATSGGSSEQSLARIDDVTVNYEPGNPQNGSDFTAELQGLFTDSCQELERVDVVDDGKTIEVYPVLKQQAEVCLPTADPFYYQISLPNITEPGRYLLQVRGGQGKAVNHVFSALED